MNNNIFEKATRTKVRFETTKGQITTEDLWDLSLNSLDSIAKSVNKKLKETSEESFISTKPSGNAELELKLELLKYVIDVKLKAKEAAELKAAKASEIATLESLLVDKKAEQLKGLSLDEIQAKIAELKS
jgi:hypothetical protein